MKDHGEVPLAPPISEPLYQYMRKRNQEENLQNDKENPKHFTQVYLPETHLK